MAERRSADESLKAVAVSSGSKQWAVVVAIAVAIGSCSSSSRQ